jgi:hypothetical protein
MEKKMPEVRELRFEATRSSGKVSALFLRPEDAKWLFVFGHGAGAGMRYGFMDGMAGRLADDGIATFRYQFPYMEHGSRRPDPGPVLLATVRSAVAAALEAAGDLAFLAGGKSMGGRMTSMAAAETPLPNVHGIVFLGFPLHPAGQASTDRASHLENVTVPMLFLQGTRDSLAGLDLLRPVCKNLGKLATLHIVDGGDHSFHMLRSSGKTSGQVLEELSHTVRVWAAQLK